MDAETAAGGGLIPVADVEMYAQQGTNVGPAGALRTGGNHTNGVPFIALASTLTARHGKGPGSDLSDGHDVPIGIDLVQVTSATNRSNPRAGDPQPPLAATGRPPVALRGEVTHALTAEGVDASEDGTGRGTPVVAFGHTNGLDSQASESVTPTLRSGRTSAAGLAAMTATAVRRLTPVECERLQGYPDGWTATSNGRPQSDAARYRQIGNSIAVPVFAWVADRIARHERGEL